jgi:hypothetical protein
MNRSKKNDMVNFMGLCRRRWGGERQRVKTVVVYRLSMITTTGKRITHELLLKKNSNIDE